MTLPAEDPPDTFYDESGALPYEGTPLISGVTPQGATSATRVVRGSIGRQLATPFWVTAIRFKGTDAQRSAGARVTLKLLCSLLC